jgi:hypothetical protein
MSIQVGGTIVVDNSRNLVNASAAGVTNVPVANATGTLSVTNGGTGLTAAGTSGNVLVSNGSVWTSAAPAVAASGGSGLFNTSISTATALAVTTSAANVFAAASTVGKRYIVHSIHVTNISAAAAGELTANIIGGTYSSISLATQLPVPAGTSVELLKQPKVLQPSDYITISANASSVLHATATIEEVTGTGHFGVGVDISTATTLTDLHTATANSVIQSILLSNDNGTNDVKARVVWTDGSNNIQGYFAYDMVVPADATVEVLEQPKFLQNGYKVRVEANQADRLEAVIAGKVI